MRNASLLPQPHLLSITKKGNIPCFGRKRGANAYVQPGHLRLGPEAAIPVSEAPLRRVAIGIEHHVQVLDDSGSGKRKGIIALYKQQTPILAAIRPHKLGDADWTTDSRGRVHPLAH
jgi:hypothetical protein